MSKRNWVNTLRFRLKTMVRYRLLFLTSAPIVLTLLALLCLTVYWSIQYTWQSALVDVSERLGVAENSIVLLQQKQASYVKAVAESYHFRSRLSQSTDDQELKNWVNDQSERYQLDFLAFHRVNTMENKFRFMDLTKRESFFDVLTADELKRLSPLLARQALVTIVEGRELDYETRGLVSRTVVPVYLDNNDLVGFIEGGLLLNNSSMLVDQLRDFIYISKEDALRKSGTVTIFLDDLRVSTNVRSSDNINSGRAVGSRVSKEVGEAVLQEKQRWISCAFVYDTWYITAYQPLYDQYNNVVGMIYTGYLMWPFIQTFFTNIVEIGVIAILILLVSGIVVYRGSKDLFKPIEHIYRVVMLTQMGKDQRIGDIGLDGEHELTQLAHQFDAMLDLLQARKRQIQESAQQLEGKVRQRTASLEEKTLQLEHHIELLNQTRDKLIASEKMAALGELTAGIAHEINNPIAVILGNLELISAELGDNSDSIQEEIDTMLDQIERIRNITRSLLQYSRQPSPDYGTAKVMINPIIEESITLVKTGNKKFDIDYLTRFEETQPIAINRHLLLQVLVNLQVNGIHAMNGEGTLLLETFHWHEGLERNKGIEIRISDQGCGIKEEQLPKIFDPFYTTKKEGTGLGLSVSHGLVTQMGGKISVSSIVGQGSSFSLYFAYETNIENRSIA